MALPETWSEVCWVSVARSGASECNITPIIETIDIDEGDSDVEFIATVRGGRLSKKIPKAETTIKFEGYPVGVATNDGLDQLFYGDVSDSSQPLSVTNTRTRYQYRVVILFTDDTTATGACAATAASTNSYRYTAINCWMTSFKKSFTDGVLKGTWDFKVAAFNKSGTGNLTCEEGIATALPAISTYTAS